MRRRCEALGEAIRGMDPSASRGRGELTSYSANRSPAETPRAASRVNAVA